MGLFDKDKEAFGPIESNLLDMRFGNPAFLHPYWKAKDDGIIFGSSSNMGYLDSYGSESLKQTIKELHDNIGNAETKGRHIVMGVGAGQLVTAAMYALDNKSVWVKPPYFSRFEQFSQFTGTGIKFIKSKLPPTTGEFTEIVTCPNNPDGRNDNNPISNSVVHDLVYNWPQYTDVVKYDEEIMIFGMAKATGHASTRVGWALVKDQDTADRMQHYVEMSTCGVGVESLNMCKQNLISLNKELPHATCFQYGKEELERRRKELSRLPLNQGFYILSDRGMFLWGKVDEGGANEFFAKTYGILVVNGSYFGMPGSSYFRMNIGCDADTFRSLIKKLSV